MSRSFTKLAFIFAVVIIAGAIAFHYYTGAEAGKEKDVLTKEDVQEIVKEYISENPVVIIEALTNYQMEQQEAQISQQRETYLENKDKIVNKDTTPVVGSDAADAVTIVEFFDYNCGYCKRAVGAVTRLIKEEDDVRFIFIELPILSPSSEMAAKYALAAKEQGKYLEYHTALMNFKGDKTEESLVEIGKNTGLDTAQLKKDAQSSKVQKELDKNRELASQIGINGTPAFIIGDEVVPGFIPYEQMIVLVDKAREEG